jgi:hypothetical protein
MQQSSLVHIFLSIHVNNGHAVDVCPERRASISGAGKIGAI